MKNILVIVTAKDKKEAKKIAQALLKKKLVACANIIEGVSSFFWWETKIDSAKEAIVFLKTKRSLFEKIRRIVRSLHSYEVPEIIALPIVVGDKNYLRWLNGNLRQDIS